MALVPLEATAAAGGGALETIQNIGIGFGRAVENTLKRKIEDRLVKAPGQIVDYVEQKADNFYKRAKGVFVNDVGKRSERTGGRRTGIFTKHTGYAKYRYVTRSRRYYKGAKRAFYRGKWRVT